MFTELSFAENVAFIKPLGQNKSRGPGGAVKISASVGLLNFLPYLPKV